MSQVARMWQIILGVAAVASTTVGCAIQDTKAPPLQGPSELSLALTLAAVPDVLAQDGASQAQITVLARDAHGQPARGITFRIDTTVSGRLADFGSLSARTLVTGSDGRATVTYTAPPPTSGGFDTGQEVAIQVTPFGTDYANSIPRTVRIRLITPGVLLPGGPTPPASPAPPFTITPPTPTAFTDVLFNAGGWTPAPTTALVSFAWNFGDGSTASGISVSHQFAAGNFVVTLTVTDSNGVRVSAQQTLTVGAGALPTASFVFSPGAPTINQEISFNAAQSQAGPGRALVRFDWNFGSGSPRSGINVIKSYDVTGTYAVVLTVTDDVGQTATATQHVVVSAAGPRSRRPQTSRSRRPTRATALP
jgi:PKD domain